MGDITNKSAKKMCKSCGKEFLLIVQEQDFYKKKKLPLPDKCSACRRERRKNLRNERKLYERKCDKCDVELMSTYPANSKYTVYCEGCYWGGL